MSRLRFGYNTNGFAHHTLEDVLRVIAKLGYDGVALTLDANHLNPFVCGRREFLSCADLLRKLSLDAVVEGGARFILDPMRKHEPSLVSSHGRRRRIDFIRKCIDIAGILGAAVVSIGSGPRDCSATEKQSRARLSGAIAELCDFAAERGVALALEPEPGMFVETVADYADIKERSSRDDLRLTLDVGHVYCSETESPDRIIYKCKEEIANVHLEDIKGGVHHHLPPGEGDVDFAAVLGALEKIRYRGLVNLELSRSSYDAPRVARRALKFLKTLRRLR
jgi:sugar phosphate isomerase/epimerase